MAIENHKDIFTLSDAERLVGPLAFNLMIKPAGSLCNLGCSYCYYLDKAEIYKGKEPVMSMEMLENVVRKYIEACEVPNVTFNWHGGEPLVLGKDFFRKAMEFERKYADGKVIHNTIQTNGILLDKEWTDIFRDGNFLVGISIDGPAEIHDRYRKDRKGEPTLEKVLRGISILQRAGVEFNTMTTINNASEGKGVQVYEFLKSIGSHYMQFMPVVEHIKDGKIVPPGTVGAAVAPWSISDIGFGKFMCDIFDTWIRGDVGNYFVGHFDAALAGWCGAQPGTCAYAETCGGNAVVEHNGDVYMCDHFVYPEFRLGNIRENSLKEMLNSMEMIRFGLNKRNSLPSKCLKCQWVRICNGECPKHRFTAADGRLEGLNALCRGYEMFFNHTAPYMQKMRDIIFTAQKQPPRP